MAFSIRRAEPGDAGELTVIAHAAKQHWNYLAELIALWKEDLTVRPDFIRDHPIFCALDGAVIVGFYAVSRADATFELEHMWVRPERLGTGIGAQLFRHAVATVRSLGGTQLAIASDPHAEGFYLRMGARRIGRVPSKPAGRWLPLLIFETRDGTVPPRRGHAQGTVGR